MMVPSTARERGEYGPGLVVLTLRLAMPLYLANLALGLLPLGVAMLGMSSLAGDRPWRADLLGPGWMNTVSEILMTTYYDRNLDGAVLLRLAALVALPAAFLGQVAAYSFLAGGILERLSGDMRSRSFWQGCRRWFWPFLRLSLLGGVLVVLGAVILSAVMSVVRPAVGQNLSALLQHAVLSGMAQQVLLAVMLGWLELSRALMVLESDRSVGAALRRASRALLRPLVLLVWIVIVLPGVGLLVAALMPPAVDDPYAPVELVQALAFGQIVAFIGAWTKVVRLAVATRIAVTMGAALTPGISQRQAEPAPSRR